jgi:hypothetical protein
MEKGFSFDGGNWNSFITIWIDLKRVRKAFRERDNPILVTYENGVQAIDRTSICRTWFRGFQIVAIAGVGCFSRTRYR